MTERLWAKPPTRSGWLFKAWLSPADKALLVRLAKRRRQTLSAFFRDLLHGARPKATVRR